ncbi:MAG: family 20 glycosylhydrolase [Bacteroidales bacterium]
MIKKVSVTIFAALISVSNIFAQERASALNLLPIPLHVVENSGEYILNQNTPLYFIGDSSDKEYLQSQLKKLFGTSLKEVNRVPKRGGVSIITDSSLDIPKEGYHLNIGKHGVSIKASHSDGAFWAIQTLFQMLPNGIYSGDMITQAVVPYVTIDDSPRFAWRGFMLDVSRQFFPKEYILKYIDWLSMHKMNKFHWHLSDDNGWRVEIKKYPYLTEKGAWRGENEVTPPAYGSGKGRYGGFYTQEDIREIVAYAKQRHVEVIPEIDLPGHSRSSVGAYPEIACLVDESSISVNGEVSNLLCASREENYKMLEDIIAEMAELFPSEYFHAGGDEVNPAPWTKCEKCNALMESNKWSDPHQLQNYFTRRIESILLNYGKRMIGWNEVMKGGELDSSTVVFAWQSAKYGFEAVRRGWDCVMMPGNYTYIDMQHSSYERGHNWAGALELDKVYSYDPLAGDTLTTEERNRVLGIQACLWAESLDKPARQVEYQSFPRLSAIAEVGWSAQERRDYGDFYGRLYGSHLNRLKSAGAIFRLNPPKLNVVNGNIEVISPYDLAQVRYTIDGSEPNIDSPLAPRSLKLEHFPRNYRFKAWYLDTPSPALPLPGVDSLLMKPQVEVTTNMPERDRWGAALAADWNPNSYFRSTRPCASGDWFNFQFAEPLSCGSIHIETGLSNISRYQLMDGVVEVSYDGDNFEEIAKITDGSVKIVPERAIQQLRIRVLAANHEPLLVIKDLRIEPLLSE